MTIRTADPFTTDQDFAQGQPLMRRLFEVDYSCPLCGRNHIAETYVASITNNLDELNAEALRSMRPPKPPYHCSKTTCASSIPNTATSNHSWNASSTPPKRPTSSSTP